MTTDQIIFRSCRNLCTREAKWRWSKNEQNCAMTMMTTWTEESKKFIWSSSKLDSCRSSLVFLGIWELSRRSQILTLTRVTDDLSKCCTEESKVVQNLGKLHKSKITSNHVEIFCVAQAKSEASTSYGSDQSKRTITLSLTEWCHLQIRKYSFCFSCQFFGITNSYNFLDFWLDYDCGALL